MKIQIKVAAKAKENKVIEQEDGSLKIYVTEAPEKNKANMAVVKLLSKHFNVPMNHIHLLQGRTSSIKLVEID